MNTPRYIEIFEETVENGQSVLRYFGFDRQMHTIGSGGVMSIVDCMNANVFPNGVPNLDGKERHGVTLDLEHCTAQNTAVRTPSPYVCKFVADNGYTLTNETGKISLVCTVEMGGTDITSTAFNSKTGEVKIANVTGDITVTIEPALAP